MSQHDNGRYQSRQHTTFRGDTGAYGTPQAGGHRDYEHTQRGGHQAYAPEQRQHGAQGDTRGQREPYDHGRDHDLRRQDQDRAQPWAGARGRSDGPSGHLIAHRADIRPDARFNDGHDPTTYTYPQDGGRYRAEQRYDVLGDDRQARQDRYGEERRDRSNASRDRQRGDGQHESRDGREHFDADYLRWRDQQMQALDDDYRAWRESRQHAFSTEFEQFRRRRQAAQTQIDSRARHGQDAGDDEREGAHRNVQEGGARGHRAR